MDIQIINAVIIALSITVVLHAFVKGCKIVWRAFKEEMKLRNYKKFN